VWMQLIADVFQTPVDIPSGSELGALGAAICAAVAAGCYDSYESACRAMVRFTRSFEPNRQLAGLYADKFARYAKLIVALWPG
jgi:L-xylulokinase